MRKQLLYCDLCNKQLKSFNDFEYLEFNYRSGRNLKLELCRDCYFKIRDYAWSLKKNENNIENKKEEKCDASFCEWYDKDLQECCMGYVENSDECKIVYSAKGE